MPGETPLEPLQGLIAPACRRHFNRRAIPMLGKLGGTCLTMKPGPMTSDRATSRCPPDDEMTARGHWAQRCAPGRALCGFECNSDGNCRINRSKLRGIVPAKATLCARLTHKSTTKKAIVQALHDDRSRMTGRGIPAGNLLHQAEPLIWRDRKTTAPVPRRYSNSGPF